MVGDACESRFGRDRVEFVERVAGSLLTLAKPTDRLFPRHLLPLPFIQRPGVMMVRVRKSTINGGLAFEWFS